MESKQRRFRNLIWSYPVLAAIGLFTAPVFICISFELFKQASGEQSMFQAFQQTLVVQWILNAGYGFFGFFEKMTLYPILLCILALEAFFPANPRQKPVSPGLLVDFLWSLANVSVLSIMTVAIGAVYHKFIVQPLFGPFASHPFTNWNPIIVSILLITLIDFMAWLSHYTVHKVPFFWNFHAVHHAPKEMNMFTNERTHPINGFFRGMIEVIPLVLLSVDYSLVPYYVVITDSYGRFFHANVKTNLGFLKRFIVTPQYHRVHHSIREEHLDKNFGDLFQVWDWLFGTQVRDYNVYPETGIHDENFPASHSLNFGENVVTFWKQFFYPFSKLSAEALKYLLLK